MGRYINADLLKERLEKIGVIADTLYEQGINRGLDRAEREIDVIPTADVAEVRHGHWFIVETEFLNCSVCGGEYYTGAESKAEAKKRLAEGRYYPFCPHCGAQMDEGGTEG